MHSKIHVLNDLILAIGELPEDWHGSGSVSINVLKAIVKHTDSMQILYSAETGSGKTTLLFSHLSSNHTVFSLEGSNSITAVKISPLFNASHVKYIEGPSQQTLPIHEFTHKLQLVMIDGPHGYPFPDMEYWHFYRHISPGGILIIDDIHIPTINNLYNFLKEEEMFELIETVETTAFFRRTQAETFDPFCDGWWLQKYNTNRFPANNYPSSNIENKTIKKETITDRNPILKKLKALLPLSFKKILRRYIPK